MFLQAFFFPGTTTEGHAGTTEHETPTIADHVSLQSGQSGMQIEAPEMEHESTTPSSGPSTTGRADQDQGVHAEEYDIDTALDAFPGSFCVTSMGTVETTILVDENLVP